MLSAALFKPVRISRLTFARDRRVPSPGQRAWRQWTSIASKQRLMPSRQKIEKFLPLPRSALHMQSRSNCGEPKSARIYQRQIKLL